MLVLHSIWTDLAQAAKGKDFVVVTDDNPRSEDGDAIVADILAGFARPETVAVQRDRAAVPEPAGV